MDFPNWRSRKFLVICTVAVIIVLTLLWMSHRKPFEYSNNDERKLPFRTVKGYQSPAPRLHPVTERVNSETRPVQTVPRVFPTLSTLQVQADVKARVDDRNGGGKDQSASKLPGAQLNPDELPAKLGADDLPAKLDAGELPAKPGADELPANLPRELPAGELPRYGPKSSFRQRFDKLPGLPRRAQKGGTKSETQTGTRGLAGRMSNRNGGYKDTSELSGANFHADNDNVSPFLRDRSQQEKSLPMEAQPNEAISQTRVPPITNVPTERLTSPTTTVPTTPTTVTTAPATPPPVSLRLPSGHLVTPESLSLPESSSDVFVTMKTAGAHGESRLSLAFITWMQTIDPKNVRIITDTASGKWFSAAKTRGIGVIETDCPRGHGQTDLCCKSGTEFEQYYLARDRGENYKWFCHIDDDVYVNIPNLVKKLHSYNPSDKRYVGYWLTNLWGSGRMTNGNYDNFPHVRRGYYYGDGPCYCMSAPLMDAGEKYYRGKDAFVSACNKANLPDDDTVGLINDAVLDVPLTHVQEFNNERTPGPVPPGAYKDQISFGYSIHWNVRINVPNGRFGRSDDPSGMLSYHCLLYPQTSWCTK